MVYTFTSHVERNTVTFFSHVSFSFFHDLLYSHLHTHTQPQESTDSDTDTAQQKCDQITLDEFTSAVSTARNDKHLKDILWEKYSIPAQFILIAVHNALKGNKLDMLGRVLRLNSILPSDSLLRIDDETMLMYLHKAVSTNQMDAFRLLLQNIKDPIQFQAMTELQAIAILAAQFGNMMVVHLLCVNCPFCLKQTQQGTSVFIEIAKAKPQDPAVSIASVYSDILEINSVYVNTQEPDGNTALHIVTERGDYKAVNVLLMYGACVCLPNAQGKTPLDIAKEKKAEPEIIDRFEKLSKLQNPAQFSLYLAAINDDFENVQKLHDQGLPIDSRWIDGTTALAAVAKNGNKEMVTFLLSLGASPIPLGCYWPDLPAMIAMLEGHVEVALLLMKSTEDYLAKASYQESKHIKMQLVSLLHHCCRVGATQVARMVLQSRVRINPNTEFKKHRAPIHTAAKYGQLSMIKLLVVYKANLALKTEIFCNTALHYACFYGHLDVAQFLLTQKNVLINCTNIQHETPLYCVLKRQLTPKEKNSYVREGSVIFLFRAGAFLRKPGRHKCELKQLSLQVAEQRWNFVPEQTIKLMLVLRDDNMSLVSEARLAIRGGMKTQVNEETVTQLGLPFRLHEYILLKDWFST